MDLHPFRTISALKEELFAERKLREEREVLYQDALRNNYWLHKQNEAMGLTAALTFARVQSLEAEIAWLKNQSWAYYKLSEAYGQRVLMLLAKKINQ